MLDGVEQRPDPARFGVAQVSQKLVVEQCDSRLSSWRWRFRYRALRCAFRRYKNCNHHGNYAITPAKMVAVGTRRIVGIPRPPRSSFLASSTKSPGINFFTRSRYAFTVHTKEALTPHLLNAFASAKAKLPAEIGSRLTSSDHVRNHGSYRTFYLFNVWDIHQADILQRDHFCYCFGYHGSDVLK